MMQRDIAAEREPLRDLLFRVGKDAQIGSLALGVALSRNPDGTFAWQRDIAQVTAQGYGIYAESPSAEQLRSAIEGARVGSSAVWSTFVAGMQGEWLYNSPEHLALGPNSTPEEVRHALAIPMEQASTLADAGGYSTTN